MTDDVRPPRDDAADAPSTPWTGRVDYSQRDGGFAFRPDEIYCADEATRVAAEKITGSASHREIPLEGEPSEWIHVSKGVDVMDVVDRLRDRGFAAEPNYVMFADACGCCGGGGSTGANPVYANPVYANPVYANPVYANPVYANAASGSFANPVYANPVYASPVYANPVYANPVYANAYVCDGMRMSTARPAAAPDGVTDYQPDHHQKVVILDSGMPAKDQCPALLAALGGSTPPDSPDHDSNGYLDPVSGHGTFIAGIIQAVAPNHKIVPMRVVASYGDVDVETVVRAINRLVKAGDLDDYTVLNMSFSGYADREMAALARAIRRIHERKSVVVSSAGNDGLCRQTYPACLPDVVSVAALDGSAPAPYSNHGPWIRACAPGTDLVSAFFLEFNGELPAMPGSGDPDAFESWARWSGTSFAGPVVAAALLRDMRLTGGTAREAVASVVDAPGLFRLPLHGTVVNLSPAHSTCS